MTGCLDRPCVDAVCQPLSTQSWQPQGGWFSSNALNSNPSSVAVSEPLLPRLSNEFTTVELTWRVNGGGIKGTYPIPKSRYRVQIYRYIKIHGFLWLKCGCILQVSYASNDSGLYRWRNHYGSRAEGWAEGKGGWKGKAYTGAFALQWKKDLTIKEDLFCFMVLDSSVLGGSALGTWVKHHYGRDFAEMLLHGRQEAGRGDARVTLAFSFPHFYVWVASLVEWC